MIKILKELKLELKKCKNKCNIKEERRRRRRRKKKKNKVKKRKNNKRKNNPNMICREDSQWKGN